MAWLAFAMMSRPFAAKHLHLLPGARCTEGGGTNVVNVMLVDFRGFDTFGEIVVLGVVALTVYALLRRFRPAAKSHGSARAAARLPADLQTDLLNPRHASDTAVGYLMVPPCWCACCCRSRPWWPATCSCAATTSRAAASSPAWCSPWAWCCST